MTDRAFDDVSRLSQEARPERIGASRRQRLEMPEIGCQDRRIERSSRRRDQYVRQAGIASEHLSLVRQCARDAGDVDGDRRQSVAELRDEAVESEAVGFRALDPAGSS
jgi:hypothetical protein